MECQPERDTSTRLRATFKGCPGVPDRGERPRPPQLAFHPATTRSRRDSRMAVVDEVAIGHPSDGSPASPRTPRRSLQTLGSWSVLRVERISEVGPVDVRREKNPVDGHVAHREVALFVRFGPRLRNVTNPPPTLQFPQLQSNVGCCSALSVSGTCGWDPRLPTRAAMAGKGRAWAATRTNVFG
jgi:hypothetical protein